MSDTSKLTKDQFNRLNRIRSVALIMDGKYSFLGFKYGIDPILGLFPIMGDFIAASISLYIVWEVYKIGLPQSHLKQMFTNIMVDVFVGGVPLVGDFFDFFFKANNRNIAIIESYMSTMNSK